MNKTVKSADIKFRKQSNAMESTSEKAPYLGKVELKGTVHEDAFIDEMVAQGCTESAQSIRRVIHAGDAVTARILGENGQKVQTGDGLVMPHITGSFPTPDANPGAGNELVPRIDLGDATRNMLSGVVPTEDREGISDLGGVRILSVFTEGIGFGVLKGTQPFGIAGVGFKPSASSSAAVKVVSMRTVTETEAAEVTVVDNQNITACLGEVLPKGDYKVVVTVTDAGQAPGNRTAERNVRMLAAPAPVPPPAKVPLTVHPTADAAIQGHDPLESIDRTAVNLYLRAVGHTFAAGETVTVTLDSPGLDEPEAHELEVTTVDGAPTVTNPFINPIHGTLTGEVTIENAAVKGTLGFTPEA